MKSWALSRLLQRLHSMRPTITSPERSISVSGRWQWGQAVALNAADERALAVGAVRHH